LPNRAAAASKAKRSSPSICCGSATAARKAPRKVGDVFPEVVLLNSPDGTSAYQLMAGTFRLVCLNGMVVADRDFGTIKVPHKGDIVNQVIEGSYTVLQESIQAVDRADAWPG